MTSCIPFLPHPSERTAPCLVASSPAQGEAAALSRPPPRKPGPQTLPYPRHNSSKAWSLVVPKKHDATVRQLGHQNVVGFIAHHHPAFVSFQEAAAPLSRCHPIQQTPLHQRNSNVGSLHCQCCVTNDGNADQPLANSACTPRMSWLTPQYRLRSQCAPLSITYMGHKPSVTSKVHSAIGSPAN